MNTKIDSGMLHWAICTAPILAFLAFVVLIALGVIPTDFSDLTD